MLSRLNPVANTRVLDVGCGCGGLGLILLKEYGISDYTGIEINPDAANAAIEMNSRARIFNADFLTFASPDVREESYDLVVSLSCIDWNVGFDIALPKAYRYVRPGGHFLASFRLTDGETVDDLARSYQYINFSGERTGERACYVVLNGRELIGRLEGLNPESISGFGYWGKPSVTAVTPFERLCFAVFAVRKPTAFRNANRMIRDLQLPLEFLQMVRRKREP